MKKLVVMLVGLGLALGTFAFAQDKPADTTKTEPAKKEKKAKKAKKPADSTTPAPADKKM